MAAGICRKVARSLTVRTLAKLASRRRRFQLADGPVVPDPFGRRELYAVDTDTHAQDSTHRLTLGVRRWRYPGIAHGWQREEMIERRQLPAEDPVAIGETQAELERIAELRNQAAWGLKVDTMEDRLAGESNLVGTPAQRG